MIALTESAVQSQLGSPHGQFLGHYGNPDAAFTRRFSGAIKTCVYECAGGEEYVSFEQRQGNWVAISNNWLTKGGEF
jgi:hypothetical protein